MSRALLWQAVLVGVGGFAGSVFRFGLSGAMHRWFPMSRFPIGTLAVNVAGCLLIGLLNGLAETRQLFSPQVRLFLLLGLLGGFTTFSSFGYETYALARQGGFGPPALNLALHLGLGLPAVWVGVAISRIW